jgi:hypothetical protein
LSLEVSNEAAGVLYAAGCRYFLDTQESIRQQVLCPSHSQLSQILQRRISNFALKQLAKPRSRQVNVKRETRNRQLFVHTVLHDIDYVPDAMVLWR